MRRLGGYRGTDCDCHELDTNLIWSRGRVLVGELPQLCPNVRRMHAVQLLDIH